MAGVPVLGDSRTRNRSVDGVSAFGDDTMNVWQTLEVISGNNLRKKYHYDGYSDADNVLRTLTTSSHRRDSFADKAKSPQPSKKLAEGGRTKNEQVDTEGQVTRDVEDKTKRSSVSVSKKKSRSAQLAIEKDERDELLRLSLECTDLVQCSFSIPRISARLERLMGTNVVRLTDRKYMKDLRERIDEDYRQQLSNRIKNRAIKELERERNLILTGKTDTIPDELSDDPIFVVNKKANIEIAKRRAKLKTNREKNAERLLRQGLKWERERIYHEEKEQQKQLQLAKIRKEQLALEEQYRQEDAERGLDLLRINDAEWLDCEQSLRDFLESERNKMKERSWRIPTPYSSDPLDMVNVIRARQKFRETQKRMRKESKARKSQKGKLRRSTKLTMKRAAKLISTMEVFVSGLQKKMDDSKHNGIVYLSDDEASGIPSSSSDLQDHICPETDVKQVERDMEREMDVDTHAGYLVTKDQQQNLRYDDNQIGQLRAAKNIRELYLIAEKIILGDVEEEPIVEEEDDDYAEEADEM